MALSLHSTRRGGDFAASDAITAPSAIAAPNATAAPDGTTALNTAEWLSLAAAADGSAGKPPVPGARRIAPYGHAILTADWLSLAAAPTFALMALLTAATL